MDILIFKTDLSNSERVSGVQPLMQNIRGIQRWNVDMHDCDNVLRIEATELSPRLIEKALQNAGYFCEELQD